MEVNKIIENINFTTEIETNEIVEEPETTTQNEEINLK